MSTPAMPLTATEAPLSEPQRIANTFFAPSKTFIDLRRDSSWWAPFVLLAIISLIFVFAIGQKITWERVMQNEIAKNARAAEQFDKMPAEQRDRAMEMQANIGKYSGYASPIFLLISAAVIGGVLMATFNFGFGATVSFKTALAIVFYSWLPSVISTILAIVTMYAGADPEGFSIKNPVATNPAYFMDPTKHKFLYGMASSLDVIMIWVIVLLGIGFASNSKVKKGTAIAVIAGWYLLVKLAGSGFAAMF